MEFAALAELCAPNVAVATLTRIVSVESAFNPFAIGVVGGHLERQPRNLDEAVATAEMLATQGYNYSLGLAQINQVHFGRFGFTQRAAFDPCSNLRAGAFIFKDCFDRALNTRHRLGDALSCYNSGNFSDGYRNGYVTKVLQASPGVAGGGALPQPIDVVADKAADRALKRGRASQTRAPETLLTSKPVETAGQPASDSTNTAILF